MASFQDDRGLNGDYHDRGSCMLCLEMEQLQKRKEEHQISTGDGLLFTRNCKFCGGRLFYKSSRVYEPHGQCCGPNGKYRAKLEEYEPRIFEPIPWEIQEHWRTNIDLRQRTRKYQQLFCISSIGTNALGRKGFETHHPGGPGRNNTARSHISRGTKSRRVLCREQTEPPPLVVVRFRRERQPRPGVWTADCRRLYTEYAVSLIEAQCSSAWLRVRRS